MTDSSVSSHPPFNFRLPTFQSSLIWGGQTTTAHIRVLHTGSTGQLWFRPGIKPSSDQQYIGRTANKIRKRCISFECDWPIIMGSHSTRSIKLNDSIRCQPPYLLDWCCGFSNCTKMNNVCVLSHDQDTHDNSLSYIAAQPTAGVRYGLIPTLCIIAKPN